jgi:hypothetical protein
MYDMRQGMHAFTAERYLGGISEQDQHEPLAIRAGCLHPRSLTLVRPHNRLLCVFGNRT